MGTCPSRCSSKLTNLESLPEPAPPALQETLIVSLYNCQSFDRTQLTMCIGERLTILSDDGDFLMVRSSTTHCVSYIPTQYTAMVTHRWLFTGISRCKAEELLMQANNQSGTFLIRESETNKDCHSLSILWRTNSPYMNCVKHYCISHLENSWVYISPRLTFSSLQHLVEHYSEWADGLCCMLTEPCFIQGLNNPEDSVPVTAAIQRSAFNWKDISRSMLFRSKRSESDNLLVSEGLREAISSYLQMTEGRNNSWDC